MNPYRPGAWLRGRRGPDALKGPDFARDARKSLVGEGLSVMSRMSLLSSPLLLGFDEIERLIDRVAKGGADGYPPYNIERIPKGNASAETLRITLAVAGFTSDQLDITLEDNQLTVRGKQDATRPANTSTEGSRRASSSARSYLPTASRSAMRI